MTRYAMVVDLSRCVGCQTCTAACKHANATAPGVQWRKVLDFEVGEFPEVHRAFIPVGCMHCDEPPCLDVCPSTATKKHDNGIVSIDYDICIGCAYCSVACPYQARFRVDRENAAYGDEPMRHEVISEHWERRGVAQKCTFCLDRIEPGLANGLIPGIDPEATPVCANSCIADALHFGDVEDPESNVSKLLSEHKHYRMHEDIGTGPALYYLWDHGSNDEKPLPPAPMMAEPAGLSEVSPKLQTSWDWRAAANFILGGAGTGLFAASALANPFTSNPLWPEGLIALALVATGLFCVWLEIGRPWRFLNVYFHAKRSWMTREAMVAIPFFAVGLLALLTDWTPLWLLAAGFGLLFLYCQAQILRASKGIPAWRQADIVPLIVATGLSEGLGLFVVASATISGDWFRGAILVLLALLLLRYFAWNKYRTELGNQGAPTKTFKALDKGVLNLSFVSQLVVMLIVAAGYFMPVLFVLGGLLAVVTGWGFKFILITRAAYDQGYAIEQMPVRGVGDGAPGIKPGWSLS